MGFGVVCYYIEKSRSGDILSAIRYQIIASRTLIGFAIGTSTLNLKHWALHGLVLGIIFSIPLAFSGIMPDSLGFSSG